VAILSSEQQEEDAMTKGGRDPSRVVVVAQGAPAQGGIATFAETLVSDPELNRSFDMQFLNTTRKAIRVGGAFSPANVWHALVDAVRVFRSARRSAVVHVQTALLPTLPLIRALTICGAARLGGARVLCHVHTGLANEGPNESFEPTRLERALLRRFRFVSSVLVVSRVGKAGLERYMPGVRIEMVDNAVDVSSFKPADVGRAVPRVLFVGTLARRKGLLDLLEALRVVREGGVDGWLLDVVGSGNEAGDREAEMVRRAFRAAGLERSLLGPLGGQPLRDRLRSSSVFALPSHSEGQPIGILEAMASGLPVVATRVGAVPDMIRDGVDGLLVDPERPEQLAEALGKLLASADLRKSMGEATRARAEERYDLARLRARLADLYAGPVRGHPAP
jgi:glycosyltransferase involved in cell wall biosynthesis